MLAVDGTKYRALRESKRLLQEFGFNGFSFQHIADSVGIKKGSLYDHFESKEALGHDLVADYSRSFRTWTETIEGFDPESKVGAWFELLFRFSVAKRKLCPLSAMIADYNTLPKSLKKPLAKMCRFQQEWLQRVIEEGQKEGTFRRRPNSEILAQIVLSIGLGVQFLARASNDPKRIQEMKEQALGVLRK